MKHRGIIIALVSILVIYYVFFSDGGDNKENSSWIAGDYGNQQLINLDVAAVQKAFETAASPQDFETEVNKLYTGEGIISIYVENKNSSKQDVTLYIDASENGYTEDDRKLLTLVRETKGEELHYTRHGYGPYGHYSMASPLIYGATGALITYWALSRPFYATPVARYGSMRQSRDSYRGTPEGKRRAATNKTISNKFKKEAPTKYKKSARTWNKQSKKSGSWYSGTKKSKSRTGSSTRKRRSWGSSRSRGFRGFRRR